MLALNPEVIGQIRKPPVYFYRVVTGVLIWVSLQSFFWAVDKNAACSQTLQWLALSGAFLLVQRLSPAEIRLLLNGLIATAVFQAGYGFWQIGQSPEKVLWQIKETHLGYLTGTYINRNHCAGLFELALAVTAGFFCRVFAAKNKTKTLIYGFVFILLAAAWMKTGSRFGFVSFAISAVMASVWGCWVSPRLRKPILLLAVFSTLILLAYGGGLLERFKLDGGYQTTVTGRVWAWQDSLGVLKDYGLIGTGLGGFGPVFSYYQTARLLMGWAHAHQDYIELACELGMPVFVFWLSAWVYFGFFVRGAFVSHSGKGDACLAGGVAAGLVSLVIHGLMDFNFAIPANLFLWIVLAGCLERMRQLASGGLAVRL